MSRLLITLVLIFTIATLSLAQSDMVGHWTFDDPFHLTKAEVGNDLILNGSHTAVNGPTANDGAVHIGVGSFYTVPHGIAPNGGGTKVNEFSIVMDIKITQLGRWYCMYQTDVTNQNDGEWFINPSGNMGVGATGYTDTIFKTNEWYRIAISVKNGAQYNYYIDGQKALNGSPGDIDGRFSLEPAVLFFADNNSEDGPLDVADIKLFSRALSDSEMKALGGYGHNLYESVSDSVIQPYLQSPTPTSIYVCWHSALSNESVIEYGTTEALGNTQTGDVHVFNQDVVWHWVKLTDLQPETVYYYRCITDTMKSDIYRFKTPPVKGALTGHIRFAVFGDNRTEPDVFSWVVDHLKQKAIELYGPNLEDDLNLIFDVGDIVTRGSALNQYRREFFEPLTSVSANVPIMVSIGNHEGEAEHYYNYMKYEDLGGPEGEKYYSFRLGRVLFVAINSNYQLRNDTQIAWLDTLLQSAQNDYTIDWIFAFNHHPGHSEIWPDGNTDYVQNRVIPTLSKYSKVDLLTYGHSHNYERGSLPFGNLRLMLSGGAGSALDRWRMYGNQQDYPEIQKAFDHYCYTIVDIDIFNKFYHATTYSMGNPDKVLDNYVIDRFFRNKAYEKPPETPELVSPIDGTTLQPPFSLEAAHYSGSYEQMSSQFQVTTTPGNYDAPVIDSIRDFEDIYWDTGAPNYEPIDQNKGIDLTKYLITGVNMTTGTTYYWRARYRDKNLQWSDWSQEYSFTIGAPSKVDEKSGSIIKESRLYENYPNPFNPTTTIKFDLAKSGHVVLQIFSENGVLVKSLMNEEVTSGHYSVQWDGTNQLGQPVSSGLYFYRLSAPGYYKVNKAILLK